MADINYQKKWGPDVMSQPVPLAASVAFKYLGGKWMTKNGDGNYALTNNGEIPDGWANVGEFTSNATAAIDFVPLNISHDAVYEMPVDEAITATTAKALMFKTCDIVVNNGIQQADIGASADDVIQIVGFDVDAQTVYVRWAERLGITAYIGVA